MAKKTINVILYMSELVYDIQNKTDLTGRSRRDGDNYEQVANMIANDDDENSNQVLRSVGNAFRGLKVKLGEYLNESGTTASNVLVDGSTNFNLSLSMPSNFNESARDAVASAAHQYIVNMAIGDWFTITNKADATDYFTLAQSNLDQIREAASLRVRPSRTSIGE